jgi:hypothetical protein
MREAALDAGIQDHLRGNRKDRLVNHRRLAAVVGRKYKVMGGYAFQLSTVDERGNITVTKQEATNDLMTKYEAAGGK